MKVVTMGAQADLDTTRAWASDHGLDTPLALVDEDYNVARHYRVNSFPGWVLIDSSGNLVDQGGRFDGNVQSSLDALG